MHWLLNQQTLQTFVTKLDLNHITLKYAKAYFEGYGYPIKANTKKLFTSSIVWFRIQFIGSINKTLKGIS